MMTTAPEFVLVRCWYFKKSGKFYAQGADRYAVEVFADCIYPREYGQTLLAAKKLPGLQSGTRDGPIMVDIGTYPELVLPRP